MIRPGRPLLLAALALPGAAILCLFFLAPFGAVLVEAFSDGGRAFAQLAGERRFWTGVASSLVLAAAAGTLSLAIGAGVAWRLAQLPDRTRTALLVLVAMPLTFSGLVVAFGFILAFGRAGFVTLTLERLFGVDPAGFSAFVFSPLGLAFVYAYYLVPRVVMLLLPVLVNFDARQLAAAESLGASRLGAVRDILVPQLAPTALVAFCLVAAVALGAYGTALALVGSQVNILPLQLFVLVSDSNAAPAATAALALVLTALCTLIMAVGESVAARAESDHG